MNKKTKKRRGGTGAGVEGVSRGGEEGREGEKLERGGHCLA